MVPLIVDVSEIIDAPGGIVDVHGEYPIDHFMVGEERLALLEPAHVDAMLANAGSGIVASGKVSATVRTECARCLVDTDVVIEGEIEGFYVPHGSRAEDGDEAETVRVDETVDLAPAVLAALVIEAPFAPLHDPECKGLCVHCGSDLNEGPCGCSEPVDSTHPFAELSGLFGEDGEE